MFKWFCLKCGRVVFCCEVCDCGNTREQNAKIHKEQELQKKIDELRKRGG